MATETVEHYLGHPSLIAEAVDYFKGPLDDARKLDPRALTHHIGRLLNEINERIQQPGHAMRLVHDSLPNTDDEDAARAVLAMAISYDVTSCSKFFELAGYVLAALEHGKLVESAHG